MVEHPPCQEREGLSPEMRELLQCALSRLLAARENRAAEGLYRLSGALSAWARTPLPDGHEVMPPPDPDSPTPPFRGGLAGLRAAGISREELTHLWLEAEDRLGIRARLALELLDAFFMPRLWLPLANLVEAGPALASRRLDRSVSKTARSLSPYPGTEPGATMSRDGLHSRLRGLRGFMGTLCTLHSLGYPSPLLEPWLALPSPAKVRAPRATTDRSGPPLRTLRLVWQELNEQVERKYGPDETASVSFQARRRSLWGSGGLRLLRNRVVLMLFVILGGRRDALSRLTIADYEPRHLTHDGDVRPAIRLRPGKTISMRQPRWKVLPPGAGAVIDTYLAWVETVEERPLRPSDPLILRSTRPLRSLSSAGLYHLFRGEPKYPGEVGLVPKDVRALSTAAELSVEERRCYSPHSLRHTAARLADISAQAYCREVATPLGPRAFVQALLDHEIRDDPYGYLDFSTERGRERYAAICIEGIWRQLSTPEGARKSIDVPALRTALRLRRPLEADLARVDGKLTAQRSELESIVSKRRGPLSPDSVVRVVARQAELFGLIEEDRRLRDELAALNSEITAIKEDPRRLVAVPDSAPDSEVVTDAEFVEADEDGIYSVMGRAARRVREWITVPELGELGGVSSAQARRWAAGQSLPFSDGDPRNPWAASDVPLLSIGPRRRVIPAEGISSTFLAVDGRSERLTAMLSQWPSGWSTAAVSAAGGVQA
jgi:integrase